MTKWRCSNVPCRSEVFDGKVKEVKFEELMTKLNGGHPYKSLKYIEKRKKRKKITFWKYVRLIVYVSINDHLEKSSPITKNYKDTIKINVLQYKKALVQTFPILYSPLSSSHHFRRTSSSSIIYFLEISSIEFLKLFFVLFFTFRSQQSSKIYFSTFLSLLNILAPQSNLSLSISI